MLLLYRRITWTIVIARYRKQNWHEHSWLQCVVVLPDVPLIVFSVFSNRCSVFVFSNCNKNWLDVKRKESPLLPLRLTTQWIPNCSNNTDLMGSSLSYLHKTLCSFRNCKRNDGFVITNVKYCINIYSGKNKRN